jgi:hypothetical protein
MGLNLLGWLAAKRPEHCKQIIATLTPLLSESVERVKAGGSDLFHGLAEVESISLALLRCGPDAKGTLAKTVIPQLKDLEFHKDASVRAMAKALQKTVEAGPDAPVFPANGILTPNHAKRFPSPMIAGKTYIIELKITGKIEGKSEDFFGHGSKSGSLASVLLIDNANDTLDTNVTLVVANAETRQSKSGEAVATMTFNCTISGDYEIVVSGQRPSSAFAFTLTVQEK